MKITIDEFYKIDEDNLDLINPFERKDKNLIEIENNIEKNYKINEVTCGSDFSKNILVWNCRGVYSNNKLNFISEKIITYQPLLIFLIDAKKNITFFGYNSFFDMQNVLLVRQGYEVKLEKLILKEKGNDVWMEIWEIIFNLS